MKKILDIARVVRSKNSGPYELVLDIMLKNRELFDKLRASGQFSPERVAAVYGVELAEIRNIVWFEPEFIEAEQKAYFETAVEDDEICYRMHEGRKALWLRGESETGPYQSPTEDGMQHFHEFYRRKMGQFL